MLITIFRHCLNRIGASIPLLRLAMDPACTPAKRGRPISPFRCGARSHFIARQAVRRSVQCTPPPPPPRKEQKMTLRYAHSLSLLVGLLLLAVVSPAVAQTDYDTDNNGLIEIRTLAQLHAMRWDLNGDGALDASADTMAYRDAFSTPMSGMGCPNTGCTGYELMADLTFDASDTSPYTPWTPIGTAANSSLGIIDAPFNTTFDGRGNTLTGMSTKDDPSNRAGLFGAVGSSGIIRNLGMINASVSTDLTIISQGRSIGILAGENRGTISACYAQGGTVDVRVRAMWGGGLIGFNNGGTIRASYSTATVNLLDQVPSNVGGLVALLNGGEIITSYAAGPVVQVGTANTESSSTSGFVSTVWNAASSIRHSYCDTVNTGQACLDVIRQNANPANLSVQGKTSGELQSPGGYTGIYANWNIDLDGVTGTDDPWDFGATNQYPVLKVGRDVATIAAQFAAQLPGRVPGVTVTDQLGSLRVTWDAVTNADGYKVQWKSGDQAYDALTREYAVGGTDTTIVGLTSGTTYTVRVIATRTNAEDGYGVEATGTPLVIPMLSITSTSVAEGAAGATNPLRFSVTLSHAIPHAVTVAYADARTGSATSGTDYTALTAGTLTIAADVLSNTLAVAVMGDGMDEPDETVDITWHSPTNATFAAGAGALIGTGTITDDDPAVATLVLSPASISENGGVSTVTATLSSAVSAEVTITVSAAGDFTLSSPATLTIAVGQTTSTGVVTITANDDMVSAATQSVTVSGAANTVADPVDVTLLITDDDTPQVTLALSPASISENGGVSTVTATLSSAVSEETTITVSATPVDPAVTTDFTLSTPATLTIAANGMTSAGLVTITARDNTLDAENKIVTVSGTVTGGNNATAPDAVTLTITDDDAPPTLSIDPPRAAAEGDLGSAPLQFRVRLSAPSERQITVAYADAGTGTATSGEDYIALATGTLTFAPGTTSQTFAVSVTGDRLDEPDETVVITLTSPTNATFAGGAQDLDVTGTITDDDPAVATLVLSPASISENGGVATVTATLSSAVSTAVRITVSTTPVQPAVDGDFSVSSAKTLIIAANGTTSTGVVTIRAVNNAVNALDKQVKVSGTVDAAAANTVAGPAAAILTITDDDYTARGVAVTSDVDILTVTWDAIIGATGYKVQWKSGTQNYPSADLAQSTHGQATIFSGTITSYDITGLTFGRAYTVRVITTRTNLADSSPSAEVTRTPVLATPTGVGVMAGVDTLTVTWDAVSDASGYQVQWKSGNLAYPTSDFQSNLRGQATVSGGTTSIAKISGLTMGTVYAIRVIATHSSATGNSAPSDEVTATLASMSQPTNVRVTPGYRQLLVTWDAMTGATGYKVQWKSGNLAYPSAISQSASSGQDTTSAGTTYTIANLTNGTAYTVRVLATRTGMADSTPSSEVMGTPQPLDYDKDDNGYIEIWSLAQFDAIRHDPSGTGNASHAAYGAAFPGAAQGMGCPSNNCTGYELMTDLDFDENDDDTITAVDATYWNDGAGWIPIPRYNATFKGNNRTISNLYISRDSTYIRRDLLSEHTGLFGIIGTFRNPGNISGLGLKNVDIRAGRKVGGLAGMVTGTPLPRITACYTTGRVRGYEEVGGLVGRLHNGIIAASYSTANIEGDRTATSNLDQFGGLVGFIHEETSSIVASYATGSVDAGTDAKDRRGIFHVLKAKAGGLVGLNRNHPEDHTPLLDPQSARIIASYATGRVIGDIPPNNSAGGLVGRSLDRGTDSYWNTETTGKDISASGTGKTTRQLRGPTSYTSTTGNTEAIYANWNVDVDGKPGNDDPWFFGTSGQYPVLKYGGMDIAAQLEAQPERLDSPEGVTLTPSLDTLIVRWSPVSSATGYKVQWKSGRQTYDALRQASVTDTSYKISGLVGRTTYTVRVLATQTGLPDGLPSAEVTGRLVGGVENVRVTPGVDSLTVTWDAVSGANGYRVQWKSGAENYPTADRQGNTYGQATIGDGNITTYIIENLLAGTLYTVRVIATQPGAPDVLSVGFLGAPGIRYDSDGNGLIEIGTLAQLNAIRWDLDGNGAADSDTRNYNAAFPGAAQGMGCPSNRCTGYELMTDLDFDENDDDEITSADATYWDWGRGWIPIGGTYTGQFKGNNQTISNLYIARQPIDLVPLGLFREVSGDISGLGLKNVNVRGRDNVGALAGNQIGGRITACYVTGRVEGKRFVGGLVGASVGTSSQERNVIAACYAAAEVVSNTTPPLFTGGLVGNGIFVSVIASYAIGSVNSNEIYTGGLIGRLNNSLVRASYAAGGGVTRGLPITGGLIGQNVWNTSLATHSYWDTERSGQSTSAGGTGKTTVQLQSPASYTSTTGNTSAIYSAWNVDVDGVPGNDDPWFFGAPDQYPILKYAGMDTTTQFAAQPPGVPQGVTVTALEDSLDVRWTAASYATGYKVQWKSGMQTYDAASRQSLVSGTRDTIPMLTAGTTYTVRVIATKTGARDGRPSAEQTGTPKFPPPGVPGNVMVTPYVRALRVTWDAATNADGYKVQWKAGDQAYDPATREYAVGGTDTTIVGLTAGTSYTVRVLATREHADDVPSAEAMGTPLAIPTLSITSPDVAEGAAGTTDTLRFAVTLSHAISNAVTVAYADAGTGTATAGTDYTALAADTLTFAPGALSDTLAVAVIGDGTDEPDETVIITLTSPTNATFGDAAILRGTGTITDDDAAVATLILSSEAISEVGGVATVTATLSNPEDAAVTITVSATPEGHAVGGDFTLSPARTLTIAADSLTSTGLVTITAIDNNAREVTKSVTVSGTADDTPDVVAPPAPVTLMITDDESPQVTLVLSSASISENGEVATVTATISSAENEATTITVSAEPVDPAVGGDFTLSTPATLTIVADSLTSTGLVTITAIDDTLDGIDKTVTVSGTATGGNNATAPRPVTLTITDDDDPPVLSITSLPLDEGNTGSATLSFGVMLSAASEKQITVAYAMGTGTATAGEDYTALADGTLTFAPGTTSQTLAVLIIGDQTDEPDETVVITLSSLVNATFTGGAQTLDGTGRIIDDDAAVATLVLSSESISENGGITTVTATLSNPENAAVTITISATPEGHAVPDDFTLSTAKTLTIAADSLTSTGLVTIRANDNNARAATKSVTVSGTADDTPDVVAPPAPVTLTITDDDDLASIPDAGLRAVIEDSLNKEIGEPITRAEMATLTRLIAPNKNIRDLTGLEFATGLDTLNLVDNNIEDIQPLVDNAGLGTGAAIDLRGNPLNDQSRDVHVPALEARGVSVHVQPTTNMDVDADGTADLTDAIMVILYLFGLENEGITDYILFSQQAQRTDPQAVTAYIQTLITTGRIDIDADGTVDLTDIIMVILYIFGLENEGITDYILFSDQAQRTDPQAVTAYIASLLP